MKWIHFDVIGAEESQRAEEGLGELGRERNKFARRCLHERLN
jgi:hypothetical protein